MKKIKPTTKHAQPKELQGWIKKERNSKLANRFNTIRLRQLDYSAKEVSIICNVSVRIVQSWVDLWNRNGKEGLISNSGGSQSKVTKPIRAEIQEIVEVQQNIDDRKVTGKLICGYLKKLQIRNQLFTYMSHFASSGLCSS